MHIVYCIHRDSSLPFLKNDRFVLKTTKKKNEQRNDHFLKISFFVFRILEKTIIFENDPLLAIVNDDLSLTTVNDDHLLTTVNENPTLTIVNDLLKRVRLFVCVSLWFANRNQKLPHFNIS